MTKREARNRVAYILWQLIELTNGDSFFSDHTSDADREKIGAARQEFADEMHRRSGKFWNIAAAANRKELERFMEQHGMEEEAK